MVNQEKVGSSLSPIKEEKATDEAVEDTEMEKSNFDSGSEPKLYIVCNIISMLPM